MTLLLIKLLSIKGPLFDDTLGILFRIIFISNINGLEKKILLYIW